MVQEFYGSGVQEFLEFRSSMVQEFWSSGVSDDSPFSDYFAKNDNTANVCTLQNS